MQSLCYIYWFIGRSFVIIDSKAIIKTAERLNLELRLGGNGHCADRCIDFFFFFFRGIMKFCLECIIEFMDGWYSMLASLYAEDQSYLEGVPTICH